MKRIPESHYPPQPKIAKMIEALEFRAVALSPESEEHRSIMQELANLRTYAAMKEWLRPLAPKPSSLKDSNA